MKKQVVALKAKNAKKAAPKKKESSSEDSSSEEEAPAPAKSKILICPQASLQEKKNSIYHFEK